MCEPVAGIVGADKGCRLAAAESSSRNRSDDNTAGTDCGEPAFTRRRFDCPLEISECGEVISGSIHKAEPFIVSAVI